MSSPATSDTAGEMLSCLRIPPARTAATLAVAACLALYAVPASAQIYTYRDAEGRLVLSNVPQARPGQPMMIGLYPVAEAGPTRTTSETSADRGTPYEGLIQHHAQLNGIRADLVRAVIQVESGFNHTAVSPKGAMGLMQLMPGTAAQLGVGNPFNPAENVRAGVTYLRQLLDRYDNDETLALAAYNAGPGAVDRYGETVPPYRETQNYVVKVNQASKTAAAGPKRTSIYKTVEVIDGRPVVKYSDRPIP
ncbi:MAG: lytic transglycosylase domain-containing protein [Vicinamibacterales bacterium]